MTPQSKSSTQEVLAGLVERVTFHNALDVVRRPVGVCVTILSFETKSCRHISRGVCHGVEIERCHALHGSLLDGSPVGIPISHNQAWKAC